MVQHQLVDQKAKQFFQKIINLKLVKEKLLKVEMICQLLKCGVMVERALQASKHLEKDSDKG